MPKYVQLSPAKKLKLLNEHSLGIDWKSLDDKNWCMHCESQFTGRSVRVWKDSTGDYWLECGTPGCDGSPIDWADYPWWDEKHPQTKARDKIDEVTGSSNPEDN